MAASREKYIEIVKRLSEDDDFREAMQKDPIGTLESYGISCDDEEQKNIKVDLPSKGDLKKRMREIEDNIKNYAGDLAMQPHKYI